VLSSSSGYRKNLGAPTSVSFYKLHQRRYLDSTSINPSCSSFISGGVHRCPLIQLGCSVRSHALTHLVGSATHVGGIWNRTLLCRVCVAHALIYPLLNWDNTCTIDMVLVQFWDQLKNKNELKLYFNHIRNIISGNFVRWY
jgi:hypothetical protein